MSRSLVQALEAAGPVSSSILAKVTQVADFVEDLLEASDEEIFEHVLVEAKPLVAKRFMKWLDEQRQKALVETLVGQYVACVMERRGPRAFDDQDLADAYSSALLWEIGAKARKIGVAVAAKGGARDAVEAVLKSQAPDAAIQLCGAIGGHQEAALVKDAVPRALAAFFARPDTPERQADANVIRQTLAGWKQSNALKDDVERWDAQLPVTTEDYLGTPPALFSLGVDAAAAGGIGPPVVGRTTLATTTTTKQADQEDWPWTTLTMTAAKKPTTTTLRTTAEQLAEEPRRRKSEPTTADDPKEEHVSKKAKKTRVDDDDDDAGEARREAQKKTKMIRRKKTRDDDDDDSDDDGDSDDRGGRQRRRRRQRGGRGRSRSRSRSPSASRRSRSGSVILVDLNDAAMSESGSSNDKSTDDVLTGTIAVVVSKQGYILHDDPSVQDSPSIYVRQLSGMAVGTRVKYRAGINTKGNPFGSIVCRSGGGRAGVGSKRAWQYVPGNKKRYKGKLAGLNHLKMCGKVRQDPALRPWPRDINDLFFHFSQVAQVGLDLNVGNTVEFSLDLDASDKNHATFLTELDHDLDDD